MLTVEYFGIAATISHLPDLTMLSYYERESHHGVHVHSFSAASQI
jgi:hypothetical protein